MSTPARPEARMFAAERDWMAAIYLGNEAEIADPDSGDDWPSFRALRWESQAVCGYAIGLPLPTVREAGRQAVLSCLEVLATRPARELLTAPQQVARNAPLGNLPKVARVVLEDYSVAASARTLDYLYWAILLREEALVADLAAGVWDPPRAPGWQVSRIAYALRDLLAGDREAALAQLAQLRRTARSHDKQQAAVLSAIARESRTETAQALATLAGWHRKAKAQEYRPTEKALCRSASALAALALDRGLLRPDDLPLDVDAFAGELVLTPPGAH